MKDDKKKLAIIGVLGCIIVAVGAFQFMHGGSKNAAKPSAAKPAVVADASDASAAIKNPQFKDPLPARDPFKAPADDGIQTVPEQASPAPTRMKGNLAANLGTLPPGGAGTIPPLAPTQTESIFNYRLSGLIVGRKPAAVFVDGSGAQRLVPLNGSLDGDAKLIEVYKGRAVVSFHGKHLRLSLGGSPDAN